MSDHPFIGSYSFSWCRECGQPRSAHATVYVSSAAGEPDVVPQEDA